MEKPLPDATGTPDDPSGEPPAKAHVRGDPLNAELSLREQLNLGATAFFWSAVTAIICSLFLGDLAAMFAFSVVVVGFTVDAYVRGWRRAPIFVLSVCALMVGVIGGLDLLFLYVDQ